MIFILGGTGFIGRCLIDSLIKNKTELSVLIHNQEPKWLKGLDIPIFKGDILCKKTLVEPLKEADIVINLVGQISRDFYQTNVIGSLNLLDLCVKNKVKVIYLSSVNVYGSSNKPSVESDTPKPESPYAITKFLTEKVYEYFAKEHGLKITILRLSNMYGISIPERIVYKIISNIAQGEAITIYGKGTQKRDFLYIKDGVNGIVRSIKHEPKDFEVFNISTRTKTSLLDIIQIAENKLDKKAKINYLKKPLDEECIWADYTKANRLLGYKPKIDIKKGIELIHGGTR